MAEEGFAGFQAFSNPLQEATAVASDQVLRIREGERALIVTNPSRDVAAISMALYDAVQDRGGIPMLIYQPKKSLLDFADRSVISALASFPDVVVSISQLKMGKDTEAIRKPYKIGGVTYDHIFKYLLYGKKTIRSFWSPGVTVDMFCRAVPIDYEQLREDCRRLKARLDRASTVRVTAVSGTDMTVGVDGRKATADDGDFSTRGAGGNLPAGEVFVSPAMGSSAGRLVFDGSVSTHDGVIVLDNPISMEVRDGFVTDISGRQEASMLSHSISQAEEKAVALEKEGGLPEGTGLVYSKNSRNIGELGIGLNRRARIVGKMLEDEKVYGTCHFAIGSNYDMDGPALIHLDGLVKSPTITVVGDGGSEETILERGKLPG
jgi:leucyl aminopeptidase (aminopeptidase T)